MSLFGFFPCLDSVFYQVRQRSFRREFQVDLQQEDLAVKIRERGELDPVLFGADDEIGPRSLCPGGNFVDISSRVAEVIRIAQKRNDLGPGLCERIPERAGICQSAKRENPFPFQKVR